MGETILLQKINILLNKKFKCRVCLILFLLISCDNVIGQILNEKGIFISYDVFYQGHQDCHSSSNFIMFIDSINLNQYAKNLKSLSSKYCLSSTCLLNYFMRGKKIYCDYSLLLQSIYKSSDSLKVILEPYKKKYPEDEIDSTISKRLIYKIHFSITNKNKEEKYVSKYIVTIRLFYGNLTYLDCQGENGKSLFKRAEWGWDSINQVYLSGLGPKTGKIGILLKFD